MFKIFKKEKNQPKSNEEIISYIAKLEEEIKKMSLELEQLKETNKLSIQRVGLVRFNPFKEVGSDQSFSIALLNKKNNGLVITSLHNREGNRVYGKPIKDGKSQYLLSKEEQSAIEKSKKLI